MSFIQRVFGNAYNLWVVVLVGLSTISTAYGLAIIGSTLGQPSFYEYFNLAVQGEPGYAKTTRVVAALNGLNSAGGVIGCLITAFTTDGIGRKRTMQLGCLVLVIGGALCAGSVSIGMFYAARVIAGIGSGILVCVVPQYQAEVSTAETRGAMVCVTGIMFAWGYSLAGWFGYACYFAPQMSSWSSFSWRFPLAFQCFFPLFVLVTSHTVPYSPRWLLSKGRKEEAFAVLKRLHASKEDTSHSKAKAEFYLIGKQFEADAEMTIRTFEIFRTKPNLKRLFVACMTMLGDSFLGAYVLANYGVLIYVSLGLTGPIPLLLNACWTSFTIIGNTFTALFLDRFGRRRFLLIGATGCTSCLIFLTALTAKYLNSTNSAGLSATVFFIFFFIFWWSFFIDATQFVYVAEIFPNHLRSQGIALALATFFLASEVTLTAAPIAMEEIGWRFYLVLVCPSVIYLVIMWLFFPETTNRTLEEIGHLFGDTNIATQWHDLSPEEKAEIERQAAEVDEKILGLQTDESKTSVEHREMALS